MSRKLLMNTDDPYNIDVMKVLTQGKEIDLDWDVFPVIDNPRCWATVDPVTVVSGQRYRLTADATWANAISYDDNDKFVSIVGDGDGNNPQDFIFTPNTNHIRFTIYDPHGQLTYFTIKAVR